MKPFSIQEVLRPNETLLWQGQPVGHLRFTFLTICMMGVGIVMAYYLYAVVSAATRNFSENLFYLWLFVPFALVILFLLIGRPITDMLARRCTYYALTPERAIIVSGVFFRKVLSLNLSAIPSITYHETWTKLSTINFGEGHYERANYRPPDRFHLITHGLEVYEMILKLQKGAHL